MPKKISYSAKDIKALTDREHLISRMSLTFGPVEPMGVNYSYQKNTAYREIIDNCVDEVLRGFATKVSLKFFADRSMEVADNGRGIPVDIGTNARGEKVNGVILCLGTLRAGSNFANNTTFSTGMNGLGAAATVFCSKRTDVTVYRDDKKYNLSFKAGIPGFFDDSPTDGKASPDNPFIPLKDLTKLKEEKNNGECTTGTTVHVWLDDSVFSSPNQYSSKELIERFKRTCYLVSDIEGEVYSELDTFIDTEGNKQPLHEFYKFDEGIGQLAQDIQPDSPLFEPVVIKNSGEYAIKSIDGTAINKPAKIHVAFTYGDKYEYTSQSFVNTIYTKLGGIHESAFEKAFREVFNKKIAQLKLVKKGDELPAIEDYKEGLTTVIAVYTPEPIFSSQSKEALSGSDLQKCLISLLEKTLSKWVEDDNNADIVSQVAQKVALASHNRQKIRAQRELDRKKNKMASACAPSALIECEKYGTEEAELFICEGESAATSLKNSRLAKTQCILAIRGKFTNAYKVSSEKTLLENTDIHNIIQSIGAGCGDTFDFDQRKVGKVFIGVDADPDGNAICCLLVTLFWTLFPDMIKNGCLYKVETPLFVFSTKEGAKSRKFYAQNNAERDKVAKYLDDKKIAYTIARLKGLGEAQAETLYEFAFNPETRVVTQITVDDVVAFENTLELLFGADTDIRKKWIEEYETEDELGD